MEPLELQEMSSDKRIEGERPPDKKTAGEPTNENIQLTHEQPDDNTAIVNHCERFVKTIIGKYSAHWIYKPASVIRVAAAIASAAALSRSINIKIYTLR